MIVCLALSPALDVTYLVDAVTVGTIHRPAEVIRLAGGKGINLARAARTLGTTTTVVTPLGGPLGEMVREEAEREGLRLEVVPVEAETRACVSAFPADGGAATEFYEPTAPLGAVPWRRYLRRAAALPCNGWTAVSGRLPIDLDVDELAAVLQHRRDAGDRIAIDASGAHVARLLATVRPDLVKVNRAEAADILGRPIDTAAEQSARELRRRTRACVVVTDGPAGALGIDDTGGWRTLPDPETGRYAIGSGDSFLAGLLSALTANGLVTALRVASAAGSANTRAPGAGRFEPADFASALDRVRTREIATGPEGASA